MHYSSASGSTTGAMPPWLAAYSSRVRLYVPLLMGCFFETTHGKSRIYDDRVGVSVSFLPASIFL